MPWPAEGTGGGTSPADAAAALLAHVGAADDRLRILVGDDAPERAHAAMRIRIDDDERDARWPTDDRT